MTNRAVEVIDLTESLTLEHRSSSDDVVIVLDDTLNDSNLSDCVIVGDEPAAVIERDDTVTENVASPVSIRKNYNANKKTPLHLSRNEYTHDQNQDDSPLTNDIGVCPICLEEMGTHHLVSTICGHVFCEECLVNALHFEKKCPTCRRPLQDKNAFHSLFLGFNQYI